MINLDGVSVPTVDGDYLSTFSPYDHQAVAREVIRGQDSFFAVNESPTGSGKTLSWLVPALNEGLDTVAVYPTNALIQDQVATVEEEIAQHHNADRIGIVVATGEEIASWSRDRPGRMSKGEALKNRVSESLDRNETTILFTNPDILTIIRKHMYRHRFVTNQFNRFEMVVLDEFHIADVKQRDSLLFLIDEMYCLPAQTSNTDRFYFLSATPEGDNRNGRPLLQRIREDVRVDPVSISADAQPASAVAGGGWSQVMPRVNLRLATGKTFRTADLLLEDETAEEFASFCADEKTVVMLDGVHEVDQVYQFLSNELEKTVHRITGFDRGDVGEKLASFDVLVSNSAVEVGLDFKPERIVFSAHNAPTLIQRLGRLRELDERTLEAWCYAPESVCARIEADLDDSSHNQRISRAAFESVVNRTFVNRCDLSSFSWRWGDLEAYHHVLERKDDVSSDQREDILEDGVDRIKRHYYEPYGREFGKDDLARLHRWTDYDLLDQLKSYRGQGLQVMVRDRRAGEMKLYDIFYVLRWGDVEFVPESVFKNELSETQREFYDSRSQYAVGFCNYDGKIPIKDDGDYGGRSVALKGESESLYQMKNTPDRQRKPSVLSGIGVRVETNDAPPIRGLDHLNDSMTTAERLCYVLPGRPSANEAVYGLDEFMFLYPFEGDSIALGPTALYMHCLVQDRLESETREWSW